MSSMSPVTVSMLARLLDEAFEEGAWGDIAPHWFGLVNDPECDENHDEAEQVEAMADVLQKVCLEINNELALTEEEEA